MISPKEARQLLKKPVFGDQKCITALEVLRDEAEAVAIRKRIIGKTISCGGCGGMRPVGCDVCGGTGKETITKEMAATWDFDICQYAEAEIKGEI